MFSSISQQNANKTSFRDCSRCWRFVVRFPERISFSLQQGTEKKVSCPCLLQKEGKRGIRIMMAIYR